ncbi:MAG: hypothetical protein Q8928_09760 [Bacteroidota bacterium]|nr:hypothetical protein [Bacteroidota bacterium]
MKKINFLKSIAVAAMFMVAGSGAFAQTGKIASLPTLKVITSDTASIADTVTIGAKLPYFVHPDNAIKHSSYFSLSGFKWVPTGVTLNTAVGGALTPVAIGGTGSYYPDTMVVATFPNTAQNVSIDVLERSVPKVSATSGCDGNNRTLGINVIAKPGVPAINDVDTALVYCGTGALNYTIKYDFSLVTAKFPLYFTVTVKAYKVDGTAMSTTTLNYQVVNKTDQISFAQADLDAAGTIAAGATRYQITLNNLWDRISYKAMNATDLTTNAVDLTAVATKAKTSAIYIMPAPKTGIIEHIKNL